jgi:yopX protein
MNREIKFRGQPTGKGGIWMVGIGAYKTHTAEHLVLNAKCDCVEVVHLCQYTGLKDFTGKEIYEGDILCFIVPDGTIRHFVVEWASEDRILKPLFNFVPDGNPVRISGWCFNWNRHRLYPTVIDGIPDNEVMAIVGNIFDNPEMVKGGEQ